MWCQRSQRLTVHSPVVNSPSSWRQRLATSSGVQLPRPVVAAVRDVTVYNTCGAVLESGDK